MANMQPLPEDLQHLIEKRDQENRRDVDRRQRDDGPPGVERRQGGDRREQPRRGEEKSV
jgi:hypothetical protein